MTEYMDKDESNMLRSVAAVERGKAITVHFLRHAQATHNEAAEKEGRIAYSRPDYFDAKLTDLGYQQCKDLRTAVESHCAEIELVIVSPLTRALETAITCFDKVPSNIPWIALDCIQERSGMNPCDKRRMLSELKSQYPTIDWTNIEFEQDMYWEALGQNRESEAMIEVRIQKFFIWLRNRPEKNIAVITHSSYLSTLFNRVIKCCDDLQIWFENAELRTVLLQL